MLRLAIVFAIIALIAGGLGFYGLSDVSASFAKFFALIFAVLFVVALIAGGASWADHQRSSGTTTGSGKTERSALWAGRDDGPVQAAGLCSFSAWFKRR